jgi:urea transport system ATP-binding protein
MELTSALLYLDGVTVSFDGFRALNDLSLVLQPGEMRAIIGPNGAGKTTMMDVVTGKTRPDKGDVYFSGNVDLTRLDETQIANLGIGRKFQKPTVFDHHTVLDNLRLALAGDRRAGFNIFWRESDEERSRIDAILRTIRLTDHTHRQTAELLREINRDRTVIVVEHDMEFVRELGVRVTVLHEGSVLAEGSLEQVSNDQRVIEVYLGR